MELEEYADSLEFFPEFQLAAEPLRIDCVVIKKAKNVQITKNIAAIFREVNLLEYKSPDDYISVNDFYKVYGYACLYASLENVPVTNLTISFAESRYPGRLLDHLREIRRYKVEENSQGIYTISGDILPIQIIDSRRLFAGENLWIKDLHNKLGPHEINMVFAEAHRYGKTARIGAYLDVIIRANKDIIQEAYKMSDSANMLIEIFERAGILENLKEITISRMQAEAEAEIKAEVEAKIRAEVEDRLKEIEAIAIAQNMINLGYPIEAVISSTMLDPEKVKALYKEIKPQD